MFKDISKFSNTSDYLPILISVLIVDITGIILSFKGIIKSQYLRKWYINYGLNAVIADVLVIVLGIIIARFLYSYIFSKFNIVYFTLLALLIQIIHDILFYIIFSLIPKDTNHMLDFFKKYAQEVKGSAIVGDSIMMITACILSSITASFSLNSNIIILILLIYLLPYILNTF